MKNLCIITLGCKKNLVDSERLLYKLNNQYQFTEDPNNAEVIIINTCGFIDAAKKENINIIQQYSDLKDNSKIEKLIVFGCLTQIYADEIREQFPGIDYIYGVNNIDDIAKVLNDKEYTVKSKYYREYLTPPPTAYLKIAEGCNHKCSFCSIPVIRGKQISMPIEDLISEAENFYTKGYKELILIAQDTSNYGTDLYGEKKLADLIEKISDINFEWIRLMYAYPTAFPDKVLHLMAEKENICKYIDIPLQHISDNILKSMNRGIDKLNTIKLIEKIRNIIPNCAIRSTFIVGYPSETSVEFNDLLKFLKDAELDRVGAFTYSPQKFTASYELVDNVPEEVKYQRLEELMIQQQKISLKKNKKSVGKNIKVLIDEKADEYYVGRTEFDAPEIDNEVIIPLHRKPEIGNFYNFRITDYNEYQLFV